MKSLFAMACSFRLRVDQAHQPRPRRILGVEKLEGRDCPAIVFSGFAEAVAPPDVPPLWGTNPTNIIGNSAIWSSNTFQSSTGPANGTDNTLSRLSFTLDADPGEVINSIVFRQLGDTSLVGGPNSTASSSIDVNIMITITQINGVTNASITNGVNGTDLVFNGNGTYTIPVGGGLFQQAIDGTLSLDVSALLGGTDQATMVNVVMTTVARATSANQGNAFIKMKEARVDALAGTQVFGSIGDLVFQDKNANNVFDAGVDTPLAGVSLTLVGAGPDGLLGTPDDTTFPNAVTDANGNYLFNNLPIQPYRVSVVPTSVPAGLFASFDRDGNADNTTDVTLTLAAPNVLDADFAFGRPIVSGVVYVDLNNNGIVDGNEVGIGGVTITLRNTTTNQQVTTTTDNAGFYIFSTLPGLGTYTITQTHPVQYIDGKDTVGVVSGNLAQSGANGANDQFVNVQINRGTNIGVGYNFGELGLLGPFISKRVTLARNTGLANQNVLQGLRARFGVLPVNAPLINAYMNPIQARQSVPPFNPDPFFLAYNIP